MNPSSQLQSSSRPRLELEHSPCACLGLDERAFAKIDSRFTILEIGDAECGVKTRAVSDDRESVPQELYRLIDRVLSPT